MLFADAGFEGIAAAVPAPPGDGTLDGEGAHHQWHQNSCKHNTRCESHLPSAAFSCCSWSKCNGSVYQRAKILPGHVSTALSEILAKTGVWIGTLDSFCLGIGRQLWFCTCDNEEAFSVCCLWLTQINSFLTVQHLHNGKDGKVFQGSTNFQSRPI